MQKGGKRLLARKPSDLPRRLLALGLVCALTAPMWSMGFSLAADGDGASACPHHQVHTPECGYREPAEGSPCTHEHDDACGYDELTGAPCAHVHDAACGYVPADEGSPCTFVCDQCAADGQEDDGVEPTEPDGVEALEVDGGEARDGGTKGCYPGPVQNVPVERNTDGKSTHKFVSSWNYVLSSSMTGLSYDAATNTYSATVTLPSSDLTVERVKAALPKQIHGSASYDQMLIDAGFKNPSGTSGRVEGDVDIEWGDPVETPGSISDGTQLTFYASPKSNDGYLLRVNTNNPDYKDSANDEADTAEAYDILNLKITLKELQTPFPGPVRNVPVERNADGKSTHKFVNDWSYVLPGGMTDPTYDDQTNTYSATLSLPSTNLNLAAVMAALPKQIHGSASYDQILIDAGFKNPSGTSGRVEGDVDIEWKTPAETPGSISDGTQLTFYAEPISNPGYKLRVNTNNYDPDTKTGYTDSAGDAADTAEAGDILNLTVTVKSFDLSSHVVTAANPLNVEVNLFDYWVKTKEPKADTNGDLLDKSDWHQHTDYYGNVTTAMGFSTVGDWNRGINEKHLLLFGDGVIHGGLWNKGAGESTQYGNKYAGMEDIVKPTLNAKGYPELNLANAKKQMMGITDPTDPNYRDYTLIKDYMLTGDHVDASGTGYTSENIQNLSNTVIGLWETATGKRITDADAVESLQYLFDPDSTAGTNNCKTSYKNVTGLFQLDADGYYYYNMRENFAEFSQAGGSNHFVLYDAPATLRTDGTNSVGNFLPFNRGNEVFDGENETRLTSSVACSGNTMNHHLGMTVDIKFRQPLNGLINTGSNPKPMTFGFSGDDDVWVFVDDVLVLDMGGIHSETYGLIDFSTGNVLIGRGFNVKGIPDYDPYAPGNMADLVTQTNLLTLYQGAGKDNETKWNGNTFASNTSHTLKMFYLERGNYDSSLALRFNLQPLLYQQIRKVDQNGDPVKDVEFELYEAKKASTGGAGAIECLYTDNSSVGNNQKFYVTPTGSGALVTLETDQNGFARFLMGDGSYFNFADRGDAYYILREITAPNGYRKQPIDIVLHYDKATSMLSVANRWTTGAYACSVAHVTGPSGKDQGSGLVVAVPMLKKGDGWHPLYGSNMGGFQMLPGTEDSDILLAGLYQIRGQDRGGVADWHLSYDAANSRLQGTLSDLPGLANRYTLIDSSGDIRMTYVKISQAALTALGVTGTDPDARYQNLHNYLQSNTPENVRNAITGTTDGYETLGPGAFNREFRSLIYIPNERRELRVMKVNENGKPLPGATFGLFDNAGCTGTAVASGKTDANGMLVFSPTGNNTPGQAPMVWANAINGAKYYLEETKAPDGYGINGTVIPVVVGIYSIYADAGTPEDGVSVMAGVGRLTQTMRQYAMANDVDITLQDITAFMQTQKSTKDGGTFELDGWNDAKLSDTNVSRSMNLHFGLNNEVDYGLHNEDGGEYYRPFFVTDTGFIRARVQQMPAADKGKYTGSAADHPNAKWDDLDDIHLTNLFSLLNVVVVTDPKADPADPDPVGPDDPPKHPETGSLTVSKKVEGSGLSAADYTRNFSFKVELTNADDTSLDGSYRYSFYGKDKWGYLSNGDTILLHHDESVTILGLPWGTKFTVTETVPSGWSVTPGREISGEVGQDNAAFTNAKNSSPVWPPDDPDDPDEPEDPPEPTQSPKPEETPGPGESPKPEETPGPGESPKPEETPGPEETPKPPVLPELPDPNDPDSPKKVIVVEDGVPKTYVKVWDAEEEEWEYIDEDEVPLWGIEVPDTGDRGHGGLWTLLALLSLLGLVGLGLPRPRRGKRQL